MECDGKLPKKRNLIKEIQVKMEDPLFVLNILLLIQVVIIILDLIETEKINEHNDLIFTIMLCTYFIVHTIKSNFKKDQNVK